MKIIEFKEQTTVFAKDQKEFLPLPAHVVPDDPMGTTIFCWKLSLRERLRLLFTGEIWHQVLTFCQPLQPQLLVLDKPEMSTKEDE